MNKGLKIVFGLLVAGNVIFFALMQSGVFESATPVPVQPLLHAEKITLLTASEGAKIAPVASAVAASAVSVAASAVVSASAVAAAAPTVAASCYEWGEFPVAELERARSALSGLQLGNKLGKREVEHAIGFWVYIPPLKDKAAIAQKVAQIKARGVSEYFVVQEAGEWLNAISLGVFKTRDAAQNFLQELNAKDVRTAQVGERASKTKTTVFTINGLNAEKNSKLLALQKDFPAEALKIVSCH